MRRMVLIGLAALFAVAAVAVALIGLRSGSGKPAAPQTAPLVYEVVIANSDLPPGHVLQTSDLGVSKVSSLPVNTFASPLGLAGRKLAQPTRAGQPLTRDMLAQSHPLAGQLRDGERAVAIQSSRIVGVGGHLRPGDHVDLMVYLRGQTETGGRSSALLALPDLRVLAYENLLPEEPASTTAPGKPAATDEKPAPSDAEQALRNEKNPTIVLAVPADQVSRLLLATASGEVRLALRPPESDEVLAGVVPAHALPPATPKQAQQLGLGQLAFSGARTDAPAGAAKPVVRVRVTNRVEVFEGEKSRTVTFSK